MAVEIPLSRGLFALVDDADAEGLLKLTWNASAGGRTFYAIHVPRGGRPIAMHRHLLCPRPGKFVDHIDGNGLNNQRSNLRECTHAENIRNQRKREGTTSHFKGVYHSEGGWRACIEQDGERLELGAFRSEMRAALQYDRAARLMFGEFAKTNESLGLYKEHADRILKKKVKEPYRTAHNIWLAEMRRVGLGCRIA